MQRWEYKEIDYIDWSTLNKLGAQGWELCAITPSGTQFIFKRPIVQGKGCFSYNFSGTDNRPPEPKPPMSLDAVVEMLNKWRGK